MGYISVPRFGEFCSCCCIPLLPELECKILTIWDWHFDPSLYSNLKLKRVLSFRCEITVETPTFITLDKTVNITVIGKIPSCCQLVKPKSLVNFPKLVPPQTAPQITGIDGSYRPGDLVQVHCTSRDSRPAAHLRWIVNGKPVSPHSFYGNRYCSCYPVHCRRRRSICCLSRPALTPPLGWRPRNFPSGEIQFPVGYLNYR